MVGLLLVPEKIEAFYREFMKGRRCLSVHKWDFEHLLAEPLALLQRQIFGKALHEQPLRF